MRTKDKSSPLDNMNTILPPNNSVIFLTLDYKIIDDMKKTHVNISLYELTNLTSQWDILSCALGKTSTNSVSSYRKGPIKSPKSLASMLNLLHMEEATPLFPLFVLSFEILTFNAHNCLFDSGSSINVMPFPVTKQINA